ncbi:MAG: cardiolipin synthase ClsB [Deltaproteobacteria bacterium]|nr:cardiolipin synthase ClsB [Deltaproteobacteria bacterium]
MPRSRARRQSRGRQPPPRPPPPVDAEALAYFHEPGEVVRGNHVELLVGGDEAYPRMLEAIGAAKRLAWLEVYEFWNDDVGRRFRDALIARAREGVDVRVLVDALGAALTSGGLFEELKAGGVKVQAVFELRPWARAWRWFRRDHRKLLVVDGSVAFTGGLNIGLPYAGPRYGGKGWQDLQLEVRGPAVAALARLFARLWRRNGGEPINEPPHCPVAGTDVVRVLANHLARSRKEVRHAYLFAIRQANRRILIDNAYVLPGPRMLKALVDARRRGVEVIVILPGRNDIPSFQNASRARYRRLLAAGARIYELEGRMLHAKAAVIDGQWATAGSCNLDTWSLHRNLELNVAVVGDRVAGVIEGWLQGLLPNCQEVSLEQVQGWSLRQRLLQLACLLLFIFW